MRGTLKFRKFKVVSFHINTMLRSPKVHYKSSDLFSILREHFGKDMNLARIKAISMMICALCKVQRIAYTKLASAFDNEAGAGSSLRWIQRLIAECVINIDLIAKPILKIILVKGPYSLSLDRTRWWRRTECTLVKGPYSLSLDRTNWKFSDTNINILSLGITHDGMVFPIVFKTMDKRGNSSTEERNDLIIMFLGIAGDESIAHLMADREFVGSDWLALLNSKCNRNREMQQKW